MWRYRAELDRIIDGDTIDFRIDLGFGHSVKPLRVRLAGINTPEIRGYEREAGLAAKAFVEQWCNAVELASAGRVEFPFVVDTEKTGKYGRWLGTIWQRYELAPIGPSLNDELLRTGHAERYPA